MSPAAEMSPLSCFSVVSMRWSPSPAFVESGPSMRQVMLESENRGGQPMKVLLYGKKCVYVIDSVDQLMPLTFLPDDLKG